MANCLVVTFSPYSWILISRAAQKQGVTHITLALAHVLVFRWRRVSLTKLFKTWNLALLPASVLDNISNRMGALSGGKLFNFVMYSLSTLETFLFCLVVPDQTVFVCPRVETVQEVDPEFTAKVRMRR